METKQIPLSKYQREIMKEFYAIKPTKVVAKNTESSYAQTYANMFELTLVKDFYKATNLISESIRNLLSSLYIFPEYVYSSTVKQKLLIPIEHYKSVDFILMNANDFSIHTIKFKNPSLKEKADEYIDNFRNTKKYSDLFCTEDKNGYLVMLPINQVVLWAKKNFQLSLDYNEVKSYYQNMF